uniref:Uncharacterized protein n=2 Tax=Chelydra serpentina TaxID=8475 RepID=A0A8C3S8R2_CHESE
MVSSVVGFYSSPMFTRLLPVRQDTPMTKIIGNCVSLLVLSSALPVFSRTLGESPAAVLGSGAPRAPRAGLRGSRYAHPPPCATAPSWRPIRVAGGWSSGAAAMGL